MRIRVCHFKDVSFIRAVHCTCDTGTMKRTHLLGTFQEAPLSPRLSHTLTTPAPLREIFEEQKKKKKLGEPDGLQQFRHGDGGQKTISLRAWHFHLSCTVMIVKRSIHLLQRQTQAPVWHHASLNSLPLSALCFWLRATRVMKQRGAGTITF